MNSDILFYWQKLRQRRMLTLSSEFLTAAGVTGDDRLMAVIFGYYTALAVKIIKIEPVYENRVWIAEFFRDGPKVHVAGNGNLLFEEV
uniref:Uncharacterized protein n=1 Tax=viral metagenome TaxID=1070528 RepID=A0A6M3IMP5_9ZZZZ